MILNDIQKNHLFKRKITQMTKILSFTLIIICSILLMTNMAFAVDISLAWDPSPGPDIAGYKVYYRADSTTLPFEGMGAIEGNSPVDAGNMNSFSLSGLPDSRVYYIAVSAYDSAGYESALSNIVASDWVPELIAPVNNSLNESTAETFIWGVAPQGYDVTYTLYYGTDQALGAGATSINGLPGGSFQPQPALALLIGFGFVFLLTMGKKKAYATGATALALGLTLVGCGGNGSGLSGETTSSVKTPLAPPAESIVASPSTTAVFVGKADYQEIYDLIPSTTYYWKVVAEDVSNPSLRYESQTKTFTTAAN